MRSSAVLVAALGCAPTTMQTARTNGKGNLQLAAEPGAIAAPLGQSIFILPRFDLSLRYGLSDRFDLGARFGTSLYEVQAKLLITKVHPAHEGAPLLALAPSTTFFPELATGPDRLVFDSKLPILVGIPIGYSELVIAPRGRATVTWFEGAQDVTLYAGGSLGVAGRISDTLRILPEAGIDWPLVGPLPWTITGGVAVIYGGPGPEPPAEVRVETDAPPPPPAPSGPGAAGAAEWLQGVLPQVQGVLTPLRGQVTGLVLEPGIDEAERRRLALCAAAKDSDAKLAALSAFPGDDAVREAARTFAATVATECEGDLAKWVALRRPIVSDADLAEAATIGLGAERRIREADEAYFGAIDAFSARHRVRITVTRPAAAPEWDRAGLAPEGSAAPPRMVAQLAFAYSQQLVPPVKGLTDAYDAWRDAVVQWKGPAAEAHAASREKAGRALEAVNRVEPWLGDASLRDAARGVGAAIQGVLDGKGAEVTKKSVAGPQSQREVEALNQLLAQGDAEVEAAVAKWDAAVVAFQEKWGVPAYQAWLKTATAPR